MYGSSLQSYPNVVEALFGHVIGVKINYYGCNQVVHQSNPMIT
jgi:hypothetical protein